MTDTDATAILLKQERQGRVLTLTLNRPAARNGITGPLTVELNTALKQASTDPDVGVVVLQGSGNDFCAGADLNGMAAGGKRTHSTEELLLLGGESSLLLHTMDKPTIAVVRGAAAGGGLSLMAACDFRLADTTAVFSFAYTNIGLSGDYGSLYLLERLLGAGRTLEFALLCAKLRAPEALALGLLSRVCEPEALQPALAELLAQLFSKPPFAMAKIKENLRNVSAGMTPTDYIAAEADNFVACRNSADHQEAMRAFIEKRPPRFGQEQ